MKKQVSALSLAVIISISFSFIFSGCRPAAVSTVVRDQNGFTLILLPDTQFYCEKYPDIFYQQTRWVADNVERLNCKFVIHLGDIVDNNDDTSQWRVAQKAMSTLDKKIPYCFAVGNHDMPTKLFNENFPLGRYKNEKWFGGSFDQTNDNTYHFFSAAGMDFMILCLQYDPNEPKLVEWANKTIEQHPNHRVIVVTHGFLNRSRMVSEGTQVWNNVVRKHKNIFLVLCGHLTPGRRMDKGDNGNIVNIMLADYQNTENGGSGWLRILKFIPQENKIESRTFSTMKNRFFVEGDDKYSKEPVNNFDLAYEMSASLSAIR